MDYESKQVVFLSIAILYLSLIEQIEKHPLLLKFHEQVSIDSGRHHSINLHC